MKIIITLFAVVAMISCSTASIETEAQPKGDIITNQLNKLAATTDPGIQYVVVNKHSSVVNFSVGLSDVVQNVSLTTHHTMTAFSMTKVLTAIAVLQLVERGQINLDDKVSAYIEHPYSPEITIRHLLNHTSGIPNPIPLKWVHLAEAHDSFDEKAALTKVLSEHPDPDAQPGEEYKYTNIGYWLLGIIIEEVTGVSYSDYVTKNIFEKLSLSSNEIGFLITNNHSKGYLKKWSLMNLFGRLFIDKNILGSYEGKWLNIKNVYLNGPSFGGIVGSASAFSKILQDFLSEQSKLLSSNTKKLLYSQQTVNSGKQINMTLGWHIDELHGVKYYYKEGGGAGFHCEMRIYPDSGLASVLMTNRTSFNSRKILSELDANFVVN